MVVLFAHCALIDEAFLAVFIVDSSPELNHSDQSVKFKHLKVSNIVNLLPDKEASQMPRGIHVVLSF